MDQRRRALQVRVLESSYTCTLHRTDARTETTILLCHSREQGHSPTHTGFQRGQSPLPDRGSCPPPPPLPHTYNIHSVTCTTAQAFKEGEARFLIATDVGARGLDISGLPYVINMTLPDRSEDYIHR